MNASKERFGQKDLKTLFKDAKRIVVARGKRFEILDLKRGSPGPAALAGLVLGPTGNLRAPAIRTGKTWVIGFNEDVYAETFGGLPA